MVIKMYDLAGAEDERRFSPYCWRVKMALAHKGLEVETIPWRYMEKEKIAFSGQGKVPVIIDGDTTVYDSWDIANYLDDKYPNKPSLFGSAEAKGQALFIKHWTENVLHPNLYPLPFQDIVEHLHEKDKVYFRESKEAWLGKSIEEFVGNPQDKLKQLNVILNPLRKTLEMQSFIAGEQPNFSDYIVFAPFQLARSVSPQKLLAKEDPIYVWRDKMLNLYDRLAGKAMGYDV